MDPYAAAPPPSKPKTSPWVYVGCGCAALVALAVVAFLAFIWFARQQAKTIKQGFTDPKVREQKTREILPYRELPAGYYPFGAFSIPFIMDMVSLSDEEPVEGRVGKAKERAFMYMSMRVGRIPPDEEHKRRMLEGTDKQAPWLKYSDWRESSGEQIRLGELDAGGAHLDYRVRRGDFKIGNERHQGSINAFLLIECPDRRLRFAIWFTPDPDPKQPADRADFTGTPADPKALADFANHFQFCPGG